jgi:DNA-binding CsgD family transcriptional regulator
MVVAAARAMTANEDDKAVRFERVLATRQIDRWPFEHARVQLCYGEYLRRMRATTEARVLLMRALDGFRVLGAQTWVERSESELRAAGAASGKPRADAAASVTPQELEIARLAAQGLTNKQIGEKLFLSHRTVSTHLYQLYPKLGISSRASLSDALNALSPQEKSPSAPAADNDTDRRMT